MLMQLKQDLKLPLKLSVFSSLIINSLHLGKTESILFGTKRKLSNCRNLKVLYDGINIQSKTSVKYLGASTDNCLSGDSMALNIIQKSKRRLKFLYRNAKFLNSHVKRMLASSLIQCQNIYKMVLIMSVRCIGTQHAIVYHHFVFLLLRVQEKLHLLISN